MSCGFQQVPTAMTVGRLCMPVVIPPCWLDSRTAPLSVGNTPHSSPCVRHPTPRAVWRISLPAPNRSVARRLCPRFLRSPSERPSACACSLQTSLLRRTPSREELWSSELSSKEQIWVCIIIGRPPNDRLEQGEWTQTCSLGVSLLKYTYP